jgi:hypothetical protein
MLVSHFVTTRITWSKTTQSLINIFRNNNFSKIYSEITIHNIINISVIIKLFILSIYTKIDLLHSGRWRVKQRQISSFLQSWRLLYSKIMACI